MKTEILAATLGRRSGHRHPADPCGLEALATTAVVELLRKGEVVALPTETGTGSRLMRSILLQFQEFSKRKSARVSIH